MRRFLPYESALTTCAQSLRRAMTPHERKLWFLFLRSYATKFYRQRVIDGYVADFYCPAARLVVELDGSQHYEEASWQSDAKRTASFGKRGVAVLRFTNADINERFPEVCECIDREVNRRKAQRTEIL